MMALPACPNCFTTMTIGWRLNTDGDRISHAMCQTCEHVQIFEAPRPVGTSQTDERRPNRRSSLSDEERSGCRPSVCA